MNDIHVSKENIPEFIKNWDEALLICKSRNIGDIIVGGDLWQSRAAQTLDVLLAVRDVVNKTISQGIHLTLAEGNHDLVDQESLLGYNHIFDGYKDVDVVEDYTVIGFEEVDIYVMSYFPENGSFIERLNGMIADNDSTGFKKVLYIHEGIKGGLAEPSDDELPTHIFKDFDSVLVGHYHDRKKIPGTNIEYIGASRQHNFGEDEMKGYTILYGDGSYEFIQNKVNTRYMNIQVNYNDIDQELLKRVENLKTEGRYKVKLKVSCYSEEANNVDKQKLIDAGATKVEIITEQAKVNPISSQSLEQKFDKSGIKSEYKAFCITKEVDNEMGLKYLDKIN